MVKIIFLVIIYMDYSENDKIYLKKYLKYKKKYMLLQQNAGDFGIIKRAAAATAKLAKDSASAVATAAKSALRVTTKAASAAANTLKNKMEPNKSLKTQTPSK